VTADPLGLADEVERATDRLLARAADLDDATVAAPSALPDWSRGHVLTHLARNADSLVNLLTWARTGVQTPQYASLAQRNADIEAGALRCAADLLSDLTAACTRFAAAAADMPAKAWTATVTWRSGRSAPAAHVMWSRLSEVEIHHVDLSNGYQPSQWNLAFAARVLRGVVQDFGERPEGPRVVIRAEEVGPDLPIGPGVTSPVVSGPAWAAAAWLIGRTRGEQLTITPDGPLPPVPTWG
jgi:maleylpyruvate isomerase